MPHKISDFQQNISQMTQAQSMLGKVLKRVLKAFSFIEKLI